jgi:acetylornithine deacetylase/succinyl-diaminopimelate desuccinylase-like protein
VTDSENVTFEYTAQALEEGAAALARRIEEQSQVYLEQLIDLAQTPSISATGEGVREVAGKIADLLRDIGIEPELLETGGSPIVWGTAPGHLDPHLLIYGHYDVVPPGDLDQWQFPPFSATVHDGSIWGRGVGDSKGQMIAHICALAAWRDVFGSLPPVRLDLMFDGEDEIGSVDTSAYIRANAGRFAADFLYTSDASTLGVWGPALFLGIRGALYVELTCNGAPQEWHSASYGGILPNPIGRLARALDGLADDTGRVLIDGFYDDVAPIDPRVRELVKALPGDFLPPASEFGISDFVGSSPVDDMFFVPRMCVCGIEGGYTGDGLKMAVPTSASAKVDFALLAGQSPKHVAALLRNHLDTAGFADIEITVLADCPPSQMPLEHHLLTTAIDSLRSVWDIEPVLFPSIGGGGVFATFVEAAGLPCLLVPYAQPDMQEHSAQEHLSIEWFVNGIKTSAEVLRRLSLDAVRAEEVQSR